jgi:hypothetical protein
MLIVAGKFFFGKKTTLRQSRVEGAHRMTFTENEPIAIRIVWLCGIDLQNTPIQRHKQIHAGKCAGKMGALGLMRHANEAVADFSGVGFEVSVHG